MNEQLVKDTIEERGKVYGDPKHSHTNIGLAWTGLIQQHYGITLEHPIPAYVVALMLVQFKASRSARVYQGDNYTDLHAYGAFADEFQKQQPQVPSKLTAAMIEAARMERKHGPQS